MLPGAGGLHFMSSWHLPFLRSMQAEGTARVSLSTVMAAEAPVAGSECKNNSLKVE